MVVGTVLITKTDSHGEDFLDLNDADIELIESHIREVNGRAILFDVCFRGEKYA